MLLKDTVVGRVSVVMTFAMLYSVFRSPLVFIKCWELCCELNNNLIFFIFYYNKLKIFELLISQHKQFQMSTCFRRIYDVLSSVFYSILLNH